MIIIIELPYNYIISLYDSSINTEIPKKKEPVNSPILIIE